MRTLSRSFSTSASFLVLSTSGAYSYMCVNRRFQSSGAKVGNTESAYVPSGGLDDGRLNVEFPVIQLPARTLWCKHYPLRVDALKRGEFSEMIKKVKETRSYYQYPSLCAPQIGWNVQMFNLFDGTVFINPQNLDQLEMIENDIHAKENPTLAEENKMEQWRQEGETCFAWEPCASCCFIMHYIERPRTVRIRALNEHGDVFTVKLEGMRARMALHEMDHLQGILFTRRVVDRNHVIPLEGFVTMSDWSDDYPSLEARSTFLYNLFTPPYHFLSDSVVDADLLDRKFEQGIYPGWEQDKRMRIENVAMEELHRQMWKNEKEIVKESQKSAQHIMPELSEEGEEA